MNVAPANEPLLASPVNPFNCWNDCPITTSVFQSYCYLDAVETPADIVRQRVYQCLTPNRPSAAQRVMFLMGDSHAGSIKAGLERAVLNSMMVVWVGITGDYCGFLHSASSQSICQEAQDIMLERLTNNVRSGDMVVVSNAGYKYWDASGQEAQRNLLRNLYTSVLQPRGANLVIMGDPPRLPSWAVYCLNNPSNCYTSTANNDQNQYLASVANEFLCSSYLQYKCLM